MVGQKIGRPFALPNETGKEPIIGTKGRVILLVQGCGFYPDFFGVGQCLSLLFTFYLVFSHGHCINNAKNMVGGQDVFGA